MNSEINGTFRPVMFNAKVTAVNAAQTKRIPLVTFMAAPDIDGGGCVLGCCGDFFLIYYNF